MKDEQLIERCKRGDSQAQHVLYNRYADRLFRLCFRYVKNELDAEDVLVKGFMKVFSKIDLFEYRGKGSLEGWMKRVMINECLMLLRKQNNFNLVHDSEARLVETEARADSQLAAEDIFALVLQLPTGYRTVFNLYAIEGYSHKEIADQLGISENTSKSQLSKARAALRTLLAKNGIYDER
ncbi:RNA polymerase sigma factor [Chondrinema litorale]|uniref:RNA polymerase sigma factor n=1 Tax=Chondrinema litorale TaxID=2994555 RepID=UPI002543F867|nr:sigma-70 family RNA polymerase sigma factor [Chondrinema litorale]UZR92950.1 sigma-70 family RNA polymerase sigma factor [Chondrinema litorale]